MPEKIPLNKRMSVREITLDLSSSMMLIARRSFPKATVTNDRFHVHKLYYDAIDEPRISLRWMARDIENEKIGVAERMANLTLLSAMLTGTHENDCLPGQNTS